MRSTMPQTNIYNPTNGVRPQLVESFRHVIAMITVTGAGTAGAKLFFRGTGQESVPNFAAASTATNFHTSVQVKNLSDGSAINGGTGIDLTVTGSTLVEINTNLLSWLGLDVATINGAVFNVDIIGAND